MRVTICRMLHPLLFLLAAAFPVDAAEFISDFDGPYLDPSIWNDCQIESPKLRFEEQAGVDGSTRRVVRNVVNGTTGNIDDCFGAADKLPAEEAGNDLAGPSLIAPSPLDALNADECQSGDRKVSQRNELRPQKKLKHAMTEAHWYAITFRADGMIPSCGSARWILAQWKQEKGGKSPFLAQRFDNGVLHVSVQNEHCRCVVAKADGNIDAFFSFVHGAVPAPQTLKETKPIKCIRTDIEYTKVETPCHPAGMSVYTIGGLEPPPLPDPKRNWVTMTYRVRGGADGKGKVDVYANDRFYVRVTGLIGYPTRDPGEVKFKFGHYRDKLDSAASISVDRICVSPDPNVCSPDLKRVTEGN